MGLSASIVPIKVHVLYFIFGWVYNFYFYKLIVYDSIFYFKLLYSGFARENHCGIYISVHYCIMFIHITMQVSPSPFISFFGILVFHVSCLFSAVVGLRRRNRFQFKVIMTPEQLSMNCNCHLATYRCFVCCSFIFYCCAVIFIQWYYSNENLLLLLLHHGY